MLKTHIAKRLRSHFIIAPIAIGSGCIHSEPMVKTTKTSSTTKIPPMIRETIKACNLKAKMEKESSTITVILLTPENPTEPQRRDLSTIIRNEFPTINRLIFLKDGTVESVVDSLKKLDDGNTCWWMPHTSKGKSVLPRLAGSMMYADSSASVLCISDVTGIGKEQNNTFERPIYAGNMKTTIKVPSSIGSLFITIRPTSVFNAENVDDNNNNENNGQQSVTKEFKEENLSLVESPKSKILPINNAKKDEEEVDLGSADIVIAGGRGFGGGKEFERGMEDLRKTLASLTDKTIAIGASRAAVDLGYCKNELQVGQTGRQVAPLLYIGLGISGAIQHISGIRDSKVIVAINNDKDAPIFSISDYGINSTINDFLRELKKY